MAGRKGTSIPLHSIPSKGAPCWHRTFPGSRVSHSFSGNSSPDRNSFPRSHPSLCPVPPNSSLMTPRQQRCHHKTPFPHSQHQIRVTLHFQHILRSTSRRFSGSSQPQKFLGILCLPPSTPVMHNHHSTTAYHHSHIPIQVTLRFQHILRSTSRRFQGSSQPQKLPMGTPSPLPSRPLIHLVSYHHSHIPIQVTSRRFQVSSPAIPRGNAHSLTLHAADALDPTAIPTFPSRSLRTSSTFHGTLPGGFRSHPQQFPMGTPIPSPSMPLMHLTLPPFPSRSLCTSSTFHRVLPAHFRERFQEVPGLIPSNSPWEHPSPHPPCR
ncbi:uncharacterized protein LOC115484168 isoform X2 [Serinus canaria]|uniref:uncharacterized protein LOC115484168 isoform X2 n=1 Tax=Serinus canaria TaxID=9135 RepID=UPI0021CD13BF|nr:uncharacterized protein LOC115484168 isoform X2 [Serinus canaria]